jgi:hypothetical protein
LTTDRQQRANRANAKSSTGPKTATGKARSAQNAFRHALNLSVLFDPALAPQVEAIARKIAGPDAHAELLEDARRIAESQVDLDRVRTCRWRLISGILSDPNYQPLRALDEKLAVIFDERVSQLAAFDRYERRALSRRKICDPYVWRGCSALRHRARRMNYHDVNIIRHREVYYGLILAKRTQIGLSQQELGETACARV